MLQRILFFILVILLQVLVLNNIAFYGYLNPYVYVVLILLLPVTLKRTNVLTIAFFLGLVIDLFENSGGVHIAATVLLAFLRRPILQLATRKQGADFEELQINKLPIANLMVFLSISIFVHHLVLFTIENFSWSDFTAVIGRTIISTIFTQVFVTLLILWGFRKKT